ncbi:MAG: hypothetical protein JXQ66_07930, partial [Campylobacterales bacterium]|nr:hypothetical protein [Campylobacterales bacterium]
EKLFSDLIGLKTLNLSLTADAHSFGATYNMIRHTIKNNKDVKYIIIMQTPMIWHKEFVVGGYCSTLGDLNSDKVIELNFIDRFECFKFNYLNISEVYTSMKQKAVDQIRQNHQIPTYKNGGRDIFKEINNNKYASLSKIGKTKIDEIKMIDKYLEDKSVKVLYIQGTLHYQLSEKYKEAIAKQQEILKGLKNITFVEKYIYPKNEVMGNSENHVDISYKDESTRFYFNALREYIH